MNFKMPEELGNAVIAYLMTRPFSEVYRLIQALQALEKIEEQPKTD